MEMANQADGNYLFMFGTLPIPAIIHKGVTYISLVIISNLLKNFDFMGHIDNKLIITIADVRETSIKWHYGTRGKFIQIEEALKVLKKYLTSTIDRRTLVRISKQFFNAISKSLNFQKLNYDIPEDMYNLLPTDEVTFNNARNTIDLDSSDESESDQIDSGSEKRKRDVDEDELPPPKRHKPSDVVSEEPSYKLYRTEIMGIPNLVVKYKEELYITSTMINVCLGFHYRSESSLKFVDAIPNMIKHDLIPDGESFIPLNRVIKTLKYILPKINVDEIYKAMNSNEYINLLILTKDQELLSGLMPIDKHYDLPEFIKVIVDNRCEKDNKIANIIKKREELVNDYNKKQAELADIMEHIVESYEEHIKLLMK